MVAVTVSSVPPAAIGLMVFVCLVLPVIETIPVAGFETQTSSIALGGV